MIQLYEASDNHLKQTLLPDPNVIPENITHPLKPDVKFGLTCVFTTLYCLLFIFIYLQLWMILFYKHKRLSYQSVFLFLCLLWSGLRTTLFSFYFRNSVLANDLPTTAYWFLYCFPICIQFFTLTLLLLFFAQVVVQGSCSLSEQTYYRRYIWCGSIGISLLFLLTNILSAFFGDIYYKKSQDIPFDLITTRVIVNDILFIIVAVALSVSIYKMTRVISANVIPETKGITVCQATVTIVCIIILFLSRAIYNIIAISCPQLNMQTFGYGWINVSDQADLINLNIGLAYVSFGMVLFFWEFLPTLIIVFFFRVHCSKSIKKGANDMAVTQAYFFENPQHFDDDSTSINRSGNSSVFEDSSPTYYSRSYVSRPIPPSNYNNNSSSSSSFKKITNNQRSKENQASHHPPNQTEAYTSHSTPNNFYDGT